MKARLGFVSNSSSTAYIVTNKSQKIKTLLDFASENIFLLKLFNEEYGDSIEIEVPKGNKKVKDWVKKDIDQADFLKSVIENNMVFSPGVPTYCIFGDEQGTIVGRVYDYMLREGGDSENFSWRFEESLR